MKTSKIITLHPTQKSERKLTVKATNSAVSKLTGMGGSKRYYLTGPRVPQGLFARTGKGAAVFVVLIYIRTPTGVKKKELRLGKSDVLTVDEAITLARQAISKADQGEDVTDTPPEAVSTTLGDLIDAYEERATIKTAHESIRALRLGYSKMLDRPVTSLTNKDMIGPMDALVLQDKVVMAKRLKAYAASLRGWAIDYGYRDVIEQTPAWFEAWGRKLRTVSRDRVLDRAELQAIWKATFKMSSAYGSCVRGLMLSGLRLRELSNLQFSEIEVDRIKVPGSRMKNGSPHAVPITAGLRKILDERRILTPENGGQFDFSTRRGETALNGWSNGKKKLDALSGISDWRLHDFRRALVTNASEYLDVSREVGDLILAHKAAGVSATYNRSTQFEARLAAMESWAEWLVPL